MNCTRKYTNLQLSFEDMSRRLPSHNNNHITEIGSARRGIPKATNHSIHTLARGKPVGEKREQRFPPSQLDAQYSGLT